VLELIQRDDDACLDQSADRASSASRLVRRGTDSTPAVAEIGDLDVEDGARLGGEQGPLHEGGPSDPPPARDSGEEPAPARQDGADFVQLSCASAKAPGPCA
jgi:hypothetical protein